MKLYKRKCFIGAEINWDLRGHISPISELKIHNLWIYLTYWSGICVRVCAPTCQSKSFTRAETNWELGSGLFFFFLS